MQKYDFEHLTVLIIDDSAFMRKTLIKMLESFGFKNILDAADAVDGLSYLKQSKVDVVIADWVMDPLDGIELTKIIRSGSDTPNPYVPIIILSGHTELYRIKTARDAGATEFLAKPVSSETLLKRLISVVQNSREFIEGRTYKGPDRRRKKDESYRGEERRSFDGAARDLSTDDIDSLFD